MHQHGHCLHSAFLHVPLVLPVSSQFHCSSRPLPCCQSGRTASKAGARHQDGSYLLVRQGGPTSRYKVNRQNQPQSENHRWLQRSAGLTFERKYSILHIFFRSDSYQEKAQELVTNENILLQTLGFDVAIDHPHTHVVRCCQVRQVMMISANSCHQRTKLVLNSYLVNYFNVNHTLKWSNTTSRSLGIF